MSGVMGVCPVFVGSVLGGWIVEQLRGGGGCKDHMRWGGVSGAGMGVRDTGRGHGVYAPHLTLLQYLLVGSVDWGTAG